MNKKYEFVEGDEKEIAPGVVLKRIRALVAISATLFSPAVAPGDLGGYIQQESNLEVSGNAWVSGNAQVYGDARVFGTPAEFLAKSAEEHDERTHREYSLLIEVATSRIEAARAELGEKS